MTRIKTARPEFAIGKADFPERQNEAKASDPVDVFHRAMKNGNGQSSLGCFQLRDKPQYAGRSSGSGDENGQRGRPAVKRPAEGAAATRRATSSLPRLLYVVTMG